MNVLFGMIWRMTSEKAAEVVARIGASGCGRLAKPRRLDRMNGLIEAIRVAGRIG
jgi:ABC-type phosphate transport system ATPase subunit